MKNTVKAIIPLALVALVVSSVGITGAYYAEVVNDRVSRITALEAQVQTQSIQLRNYEAQVSDLEHQVANLSSVEIVTALGVKDIANLSYSMQKDQNFRLYIAGTVSNNGYGTAYNTGLHVRAYDDGGVLVIDMTVPLVSGGQFSALSSIDGKYPGSSPFQFTNLFAGETVPVSLDIDHKGVATNWTITPVYTGG